MDGFTHGWLNPALAYLVACLGAVIGLRCTARGLTLPRRRRLSWLLLASGCIGGGIWAMHFIAMMGFTVTNMAITYNLRLTMLSLVVAVVVVGFGVCCVGYWPDSQLALYLGGALTGFGVAGMHYLGMAAMQIGGAVDYNPWIVAASVAIAVFAATAALWMTLNISHAWASIASALVAGIAVCAMHYTAMLAVSVHFGTEEGPAGGVPVDQFVFPVAVGIVAFITLSVIVIALAPEVQLQQERRQRVAPQARIQVDLFDGSLR
ncbi:MHYT domain-containing protein [Streptacidiphilus carbonis]|jgi:NO-binding membrane sensor protein with MHYT domain|uniref:MHYT domain-containing protein n=1 Tax=Streptacidiphilus carbonis TaxID=105422 RepID=UPI00069348DE|nr:MHYT domain-containing protein [Streptacidiphilus carbonis]